MDTNDLDNAGSDVPESFKTICNLIRKQVITYDEAWSLMKDLIGKEENNTKPYHFPFNPFPDIKPYRGKGEVYPYFDDCMDKKHTRHIEGWNNGDFVSSSDRPDKSNHMDLMHHDSGTTAGCSSSCSCASTNGKFSSSYTDINSKWNKNITPTSEFNNSETK